MAPSKRKPRSGGETSSSDSDAGDDADVDAAIMAMSKKRAAALRASASSKKRRVAPAASASSTSESDTDDADEDYVPHKHKRGKGGREARSKGREKDRQRQRHAASSESESASESDSSESSYHDEWDNECMGDEADRKMLSAMSEMEREKVIADRFAKRQAAMERHQIKQELRRQRREARQLKRRDEGKKASRPKSHKRRLPPEEGITRSSSRTKSVQPGKSGKQKALEALKARRREGHGRVPSDAEEGGGGGGKWAALEGEEGEEGAEPGGKPRGAEDADWRASVAGARGEAHAGAATTSARATPENTEATLAELNAAQLSRLRLAQWLDEPFFADTLPGCIVKVAVGRDPVTGQSVYRMYLIEAVREDGKEYEMEMEPLGKVTTRVMLDVSHDSARRTYPILMVSNQPITDADLAQWRQALQRQGRALPSRAVAAAARKRIAEAESYEYKNGELERIIERNRSRGGVSNYTTERARLERQASRARAEGKSDEVERLERHIAELSEQLRQEQAERNEKLDMVRKVNELNRHRNEEAEQRAKVRHADDDTHRRRTRPVLVAKIGGKVTGDADMPPPAGPPAAAQQTTPLRTGSVTEIARRVSVTGDDRDGESEGKAAQGTGGPPPDPSDPRAIHLAVEIDLGDLALPAPSVISPVPAAKPGATGGRRGLNLTEYKRQRGLI